MVPRSIVVLLGLFLLVAAVTEAFAPPLALRNNVLTSINSDTKLEGCRVNAKKEKIKRNRENMRKFKTGGGRRGLSRRKTLKKLQASKARQEEAEFIAKCFTTTADSEDSS